MLLDWFTHLGGTMSYGGVVIDRYLAWHPIDHIRWELARPAPGGGAAESARFRIVEAFGGRPEFKCRSSIGWRSSTRPASGWCSASRESSSSNSSTPRLPAANGVHYVSVMDAGARSRLFAPVNRIVRRRFPDEMLRAWVKHNIEEVGRLEYLLPQLKSSGEAEPAQRA